MLTGLFLSIREHPLHPIRGLFMPVRAHGLTRIGTDVHGFVFLSVNIRCTRVHPWAMHARERTRMSADWDGCSRICFFIREHPLHPCASVGYACLRAHTDQRGSGRMLTNFFLAIREHPLHPCESVGYYNHAAVTAIPPRRRRPARRRTIHRARRRSGWCRRRGTRPATGLAPAGSGCAAG